MKRPHHIILFMAVLLLCACDNAAERTGEERVALRIFSSIKQPTIVTRAAESHWDDHDQIGLFATTYNTQTVFVDDAGTTCSNLLYTFDDGDNYETYGRDYRLFSGREIFMPNAPNAIDIYAYYPYKEGTVPTGIDIDLTDQTKIVDLMVAEKTKLNKSNSDTKLLFEHKLVKLRFNLKASNELLSNEISQAYDNKLLSVKINKQYHKANYNLFTDAMAVNTEGIIEAIEDPATTEGYEKSYQMTVLPYSGSEVRTVSIRVGTTDHPDNTFTFTIDENFVSGVKYVYSVIVDATSIRVKEDEFAEQW